MSFCCSWSFGALLLGAGILGGLPAAALAGDKIQFSRVSDGMPMPTVDRADSEPPPNGFSPFIFENAGPQVAIPYPMMPPPEQAPARRTDGSRNSDDRLGSELQRQPDDSFDNPLWGSPTNYSSNPANKYDANPLKPGGSAEYPDGRNLDRTDPRYGQRLDSFDPSARRDHQLDGYGTTPNRSRSSRLDDAYDASTKTRNADWLKRQNDPLFGGNSSKQSSSIFGSKSSSAWDGSSLGPLNGPSESSLITPLDSTSPGYNAYNPQSRPQALPFGKTPGSQDDGNSTVNDFRAWGSSESLFHSQPAEPVPRKPLPAPSLGGPPRQEGGAFLPWPKRPGAIN